METETTPSSRSTTRQPRASGRAPTGASEGRVSTEAGDDQEAQYDLLTAALIGAVIGAGATLLLRRGPSGRRPIAPVAGSVASGAKLALRAAKAAGTAGARGARWARDRGEEVWESVPVEELEQQAREQLARARERLDETVEREMRALRKALRRQKSRFGA